MMGSALRSAIWVLFVEGWIGFCSALVSLGLVSRGLDWVLLCARLSGSGSSRVGWALLCARLSGSG